MYMDKKTLMTVKQTVYKGYIHHSVLITKDTYNYEDVLQHNLVFYYLFLEK